MGWSPDELWVGGLGRRYGGSPIGGFGFAGDFYELTVGANWKPNANLAVPVASNN